MRCGGGGARKESRFWASYGIARLAPRDARRNMTTLDDFVRWHAASAREVVAAGAAARAVLGDASSANW